MRIGENIQIWALKNFGTIVKCAKVLDVAPSVMHRYIKEDSLPGALFLQKMLNNGCDINWLLGGRGEAGDADLPPQVKGMIKRLEDENLELKNKLNNLKSLMNS
jgi:hypothetical protein